MGIFNVLFLAGFAAKLVAAKDVHLEWNVTWVNAAPDGFERPVIGINNQWPCPQVDVDVGDRVIVDVYNGLGNQSTGIHWHGFKQYGTAIMDGATDVTQCPVAPGQHMQYHFEVSLAWHRIDDGILTMINRPTKLEPTGITRTTWDNTPMDSVELSLSTTPNHLSNLTMNSH